MTGLEDGADGTAATMGMMTSRHRVGRLTARRIINMEDASGHQSRK
jgi:hypothetical protein